MKVLKGPPGAERETDTETPDASGSGVEVADSPRRLHIGGKVAHPQWEVLDALPGQCVDHVGDARDLSRFPDGTFEELYASHVLEHFDYAGELDRVLGEWFRVLRPGGRLYISVPDMDNLARLFLMKEKLPLQDRFHVMRMMFGGHVTKYDYHQVGFNPEILASFLARAGFANLRKVEDFPYFRDTSRMRFHDVPVSANMVAERPGDTGPGRGGEKKEPNDARDAKGRFRARAEKTTSCLGQVLSLFGNGTGHPEVLILGDSVMINISRRDVDKTPLKEMIVRNLAGKYRSAPLCGTAYHPGVYFQILRSVLTFNRYPEWVILPVNMRSFSPSWDYHPVYQCREALTELEGFLQEKGLDSDTISGLDWFTSPEEFLRMGLSYPLTGLGTIGEFERVISERPGSEKEKSARYHEIFIYYYLHGLTGDNRKLLLLQKAVDFLCRAGVHVVAYLTPVNYQAGVRYVGPDFLRYFERNVEKVTDYFASVESGKVVFRDFSRLFGSESFARENETAEHLNQGGREGLARLVSECVLKL
ncbi:MAG: methyltransferase domain-containing protein [Deltaproteobacteria bacterium]|nr:methyltransferase domain-containing protein [Deltaproteobacteria bacterium]